jgi:hypothetical protein
MVEKGVLSEDKVQQAIEWLDQPMPQQQPQQV